MKSLLLRLAALVVDAVERVRIELFWFTRRGRELGRRLRAATERAERRAQAEGGP